MLHFVPLHTDWKEMLSLLSCGTEKALRRLGNILRPIVLNKLIIFYGGTLATVWACCSFKTRKLLPSKSDYRALPENFQLSPGDVILLDIRDEDDVSLVSEQIQMFCKGHGIDRKTGFEAAVCFEELAVNVIRYGFPTCKKRPGINLRLVYDQEELILRLQDNCPPFNVGREIAMAIDEGAVDPVEKLGLRILGGMESNIQYVQSLETNNVIICFPIKVPKNG